MSIRKLAGETAIYGLSSILGRLLYFLLVPLYVRIFDPGEYGVVTDLFSFVGLMLIFYTYRFETAYYRYGTDKDSDRQSVFSTGISSIIMSSLVLSGLMILFQEQIAAFFRYPEYSYIIAICAGILALDAISEIPLSKLRLEAKAWRFAGIKLTNIVFNIGFNLFFLVLCPYLQSKGIGTELLEIIYDDQMGIGYIFISNFLSSFIQFIMLLPYIKDGIGNLNLARWRQMIRYSFPLIIVGISFSINELLDRKIMIWFLPGSVEENKIALGAYGACYKLTMMMALFTQAFRYGAEPFFFIQKNEQNATKIYSKVAHYYGIVGILGCLFTLLYLDLLKLLLQPAYWTALGVIPILLLANLINGMYYNVSIWYRLKDKTWTGAWIAMIGATVTIILNIWWLPIFGFYGAAWATLICYSIMLIICYSIGQKNYAIPYRVKDFLIYLLIGVVFYVISIVLSLYISKNNFFIILSNTFLLFTFVFFIIKKEQLKLSQIKFRVRDL
jgi:O-antigen/teichoic acid export membrane protein